MSRLLDAAEASEDKPTDHPDAANARAALMQHDAQAQPSWLLECIKLLAHPMAYEAIDAIEAIHFVEEGWQEKEEGGQLSRRLSCGESECTCGSCCCKSKRPRRSLWWQMIRILHR